MKNPLLKIGNLNIYFALDDGLFTAVEDINFSIETGKTLALVGESGSGKTLTALAVMQLLPGAAHLDPRSDILLREHNLTHIPEIDMRKIRGRHVSIVFQEASTALNPVLTIGQQIQEVLKWHFKMNRRQRRQRALSLLDEVGIADPVQCAKSYSHQLSGGMRQRAMIAAALAGEPELLIADEPTTALDVTIQAQVLDLLVRIQQKKDMTLLFITHDLGIVYQIADHIAVLQHGKIVEQADTKTFFANPQHPYSRQLFAAVPSWEHCLNDGIDKNDLNLPPQLSVKDLKIYFPIRKGILKRTVGYIKAVDGVSFDVYKGETFALVGESGSGKTTIAKSILQLLPPTAGSVKFLDQELTHLSAHRLHQVRADLQIVFQDPYASLDPRMMVGDILEEGMLAQKIGKNSAARQAIIDEILARVDLPQDCKNRYPHEFSGGQRQRICIARALAMQPKFIICDEPTSALDVNMQMQILQLLKRLQQELDLSYLLITHNIAVVAYMAHHVAVMHHGIIVEQGPVEQILHHPQQPYTKKLLAAVPKIPQNDYRIPSPLVGEDAEGG